MLFKRFLSVLFALLMIFGMVSVHASAVSDGTSYVSEEEAFSKDIAAVGSRNLFSSAKVNLLFFENVFYFIETQIFGNYKIGNERKLSYAAQEGGDKWTLKNDINVRYTIAVYAHKELKIDGKGHSISTGNRDDLAPMLAVFRSLRICNTRLNIRILNNGYTVLEGGSSVKLTDRSGICIRNYEGGTLELLDMYCDCILNIGLLKMPEGHSPDIAKVISEEDSKITMEAGHIGTLFYNAEQTDGILTITGGEIDEYTALKPVSFEWPLPSDLETYISARFGVYSPAAGSETFHKGVDIAATGGITGKPVLAAAAGEVIKAGYDNSLGYYVLILHNDAYITLYAHCSKLIVKAGAWVTAGQHIADAGSSGKTTGPHLHFAVIEWTDEHVKYMDPMNYVKQP